MSRFLVNHILKQHGISHFGFTALERPLSIDIYKDWLKKDYHADMKYLEDHLPQKEFPQQLAPQARHAIVWTHPYPIKNNRFPLKELKIAKYALGEDYHYWLKNKATSLCSDLKTIFPNETFVGFTDSSPVLERDLAQRAGLGWIGKNSCLISRQQGSYFLIAEIYTSLDISSTANTSPDHCGTCNLCVESCPTQAINNNRTLDAHKCISYWTIESKKAPPPFLANQFSGWFFGCDICQDVCPWNGKVFKRTTKPAPQRSQLIDELRWVLSSSNKQLERAFQTTPLLRARGKGLKRNALIVIANLQLHELKEDVLALTHQPQLADLALWTQQQLLSSSPR